MNLTPKSSHSCHAQCRQKATRARLRATLAAWLPISRNPGHPEASRGDALVIRAVEAQCRLLGLLVTASDVPATTGKQAEAIEEALAASPAMREAATQMLDRAERIAVAQPKN